MRRYVELAKRDGPAKIVVFTMASSVPLETGPGLVAEFKGYGVTDVAYLPPDPRGGPGPGQPQDPRRRHRRLVLRRRPGQADGGPARTRPFTSACSSSTKKDASSAGRARARPS
ncbi:MAG: hypothetical protein MZV63_65940 [Marinilabiliales bacterium]|nr:hypothetical protein [Marinilabiliales bacterium]